MWEPLKTPRSVSTSSVNRTRSRSRLLATSLAAGAALIAFGPVTASVAHAQAVGSGTLFPTSNRPFFVTSGPDGNLWFTDLHNLDQLTTTGTETDNPNPGFLNVQLAAGDDGGLYQTSIYPHPAIVKMDTSARVVWQIPIANVGGMAPGPDGNIWFTVQGSNNNGMIGFVTPSAHYKEFMLPTAAGVPASITAGADGDLWTTLNSGQIARTTPSGVTTLFPVTGSPDFTSPDGAFQGPQNNITLGPDGNIWFAGSTNTGTDMVGSITPTGVVNEYATPTQGVRPGGITTGADGNLWVNEALRTAPGCPNYGAVARVTPAGVISEFDAGCNDLNDKFNIVAGPDGNVWNAAYYGIGVNMIVTGASTSSCSAISGSATSASVSRGASEAIVATIANCADIPRLMKLTSKTILPAGCGSISSHVSVPLQPWVQTMPTFKTSTRCRGSYTVKLTLSTVSSTGTVVVGTAAVTYNVT